MPTRPGSAATPKGRASKTANKPVIGLAGGIGAGKSTVAAELGRLGCLVLDADEQAHRVLEQPAVIERIRRWWGDEVLDRRGRPVRSRIARRVFGQPEELARLTRLVHPRVHRMRREAIARRRNDPRVVAFVVDAPLLFEAGVDRECDVLVFVDAPLRLCRRRVLADRGWDQAELDRRQGHQMDLAAKRARCDYVVRNDGTRAELAGRVKRLLARMLRDSAKKRV